MRRIKVECCVCLDTVLAINEQMDAPFHNCACCACYNQGALTEEEALVQTQSELRLSKKAACRVMENYKQFNHKLVHYPNGFLKIG